MLCDPFIIPIRVYLRSSAVVVFFVPLAPFVAISVLSLRLSAEVLGYGL